MKILWSWLQDHGNVGIDPETAAQALTFSGTETEVVQAYPWADHVHVARVLSLAEHPDAARLRVCEVQVSEDRVVTIVCGAANVRAGMHTMVALPGCVLPGHNRPLEASALRGVVSHGMLCSAKELAMEDVWGDNDGLVELDPAQTVVGQSLRDFLPAGDALLLLNVTPNRGDLLSHRGVARELVALGFGHNHGSAHGETVVPGEQRCHGTLMTQEAKASLMTVTAPACSLFMLGQLDNIRADLATPGLMRRRLAATDSSWHNVCVDWTNYMAQDMGQPLHVYDAQEICGGVTVRFSRQGEEFVSLQGQSYALPDNVMVVADDAGILSVAGIMGGMRGRCTENSKSIVMEAACFDPKAVARAGQALGLQSASRSRFERGVDSGSVSWAFGQSLSWLCEHTKGQMTRWDQYGSSGTLAPIAFAPEDISRRCGVDLPREVIMDRLKKFGALVVASSPQDPMWQVTPPTWRHDWIQSWDCINEVVRGQGYADIPDAPWQAPALRPHVQKNTGATLPVLDYRWIRKARQWWIAQGVFEAVTWSFVSQSRALSCVEQEADLTTLQLVNPLSVDMAVLRPRVVASLYDIIEHHRRHRVICGPVFEIGPCFKGLQPHDQQEHLALMWPKERAESFSLHTQTVTRSWSFYDIRDMVSRFVAAMGFAGCTWEAAQEPSYHPGQCATVWYTCPQEGRVCLGVVGAAHPHWGTDVFMAEFHLNKWPQPVAHGFFPIPSLHAMRKDVSFFVPKSTVIGSVLQAMKEDNEALKHIDLIDCYDGSQEEGQDSKCQTPPHSTNKEPWESRSVGTTSVTIACYFQPTERAFTASDTQVLLQRIVACAERYDWVLRGRISS